MNGKILNRLSIFLLNQTIKSSILSINLNYFNHPIFLSISFQINNFISLNKFHFKFFTQPIFLGNQINLNLHESQFSNSISNIIKYNKTFLNNSLTTIEKCNFFDCNDLINGGAISSIESQIYIKDCLFMNCKSNIGGSCYFLNCTLFIINSNFSNCYSMINSGAIYIYGGISRIENILCYECESFDLISGISLDTVSFVISQSSFLFGYVKNSIHCLSIISSTGTISNCEFIHNECQNDLSLGLIYISKCFNPILILNCIFFENKELNLPLKNLIFLNESSFITIKECIIDIKIKNFINNINNNSIVSTLNNLFSLNIKHKFLNLIDSHISRHLLEFNSFEFNSTLDIISYLLISIGSLTIGFMLFLYCKYK